MTARKVVMPALAIAGPKSDRAFLVLLILVPVIKQLKGLQTHNKDSREDNNNE